MKLRIRGNKIRFRLGRTEVENLERTGSIEEKLSFGPPPQEPLTYSIAATEGDKFTGTFQNGNLKVGIPGSIVSRWAANEEVSIDGSQNLSDGTTLSFLIEKDFVCLNAHDDEDQSDRYPHPKGEGDC
jgi:hypothetical protein